MGSDVVFERAAITAVASGARYTVRPTETCGSGEDVLCVELEHRGRRYSIGAAFRHRETGAERYRFGRSMVARARAGDLRAIARAWFGAGPIVPQLPTVALERNRARVMLLYACRYALGRTSTAPLDATEAVRFHAEVMETEDLRGLADDVDGELRADQDLHPLPHATAWRAFAAWCRDEAQRRDDTDRAAARGGERVLRERGVTL